ncbi:MAG: hypothetical protein IT342_11695 [Candidatus Melainabacteria bacterium]|nr:hypothetical protein [Candidatus Melainabacteria bacterium]
MLRLVLEGRSGDTTHGALKRRLLGCKHWCACKHAQECGN